MSNTNRKDEVLTSLADGIAALAESDRWQEWLQAQSRFHHYSFNNVILIDRQDPEATRVAGFHAWKKLGRCVRKGERAIWILAPMTRKVTDEDERPDTETGTRQLIGFRPVPVFDLRQTDGEPLPAVCSKLQGDAPDIYSQLVAVAHSIGYTVEEDYLTGSVNGDCNYAEHLIRIEARNAERQQVKTLAHELGHAMLHEGNEDRALGELEAESVAFIVMSALGVDSSDYSFGYVAGWSGGSDEAIAAIKASGSRIQSAADQILQGVDDQSQKEAAA
ncbi:MAG: ArdC-like ssDNA-binding domain-containing protein [Candidatus Nanopelagicales bacterium]|nr:ArdC-like ssDNA-binding domain-containing protein [Candidatus Nanopelagicales bacterium]